MHKRISEQIEERSKALADHPDREVTQPCEGARTDVDVVGVIAGRKPMPFTLED